MPKTQGFFQTAVFQEASEVLKTVEDILANGRYDEIASNAHEYVKSNDWEVITDKFEEAMKKLL